MNAILIENFISKNWQENLLIEMESWWNYDALFKAQWVVLANLLSEMRKVAIVKQVGFHPRFLDYIVVCHSKKLTEHPGKKCRELYHISLQGKCNSLTYIRLFCFWRLNHINVLCINLSYSPKDQSLKFLRKNIENWLSWKMIFFGFWLLGFSKKKNPNENQHTTVTNGFFMTVV